MTRIKSSFLIGLASLLCVGTVQADECGWCETCPPRDDCGLYVGAHLLYWTACQNNLDYYFRASSDCNHNPVNQVRFADYDWSVGYRVFGGYRLGCDDWNATAIFTHWNNKANGSVGKCSDSCDRWFAKNHLDYDVLDILLSREYQLSCSTVFSPFLGFRAVWLDQKWEVYKEFLTMDKTKKECFGSMSSDLFAAGIHMGTDYKWEICDGLSVYGIAAATLTEASVDNRHEALIPELMDPFHKTKESYCMPFAGYNLAAGVAYETCFESCGENSWFEFVLGYEFNHWFHTPDHRRDLHDDDAFSEEAPTGLDTSTKGQLVLHGLHIGGTFFF